MFFDTKCHFKSLKNNILIRVKFMMLILRIANTNN